MKRYKSQFFTTIQNEASHRWEQLESDPGLAGPWRQLFEQVQSPRHVLSELLQNADDAGASWAAARLDDGDFYFVHNGEDFEEKSFRSLCNFGYSEKRNLHTIGFRGLGFKSTFSLGHRVEVFTPTLAFAFEKSRFTEPIWLEDAPRFDFTTIKIHIENQDKEKWLLDNIAAWKESTIPLLFFRNIRDIELQGEKVSRRVISAGPITNSEWVSLQGSQKQQILHIWSDEENFPPDALEEVRKVRGSDGIHLPPCKVEILVGVSSTQRLYVILPTEVQVDLPYSCNAPFIPDPARTGIKDPIISPTNRWLLNRVGILAAESMKTWLNPSDSSTKERAKAYCLLIKPPSATNSLGGNCSDIVASAFGNSLKDDCVLLSENGLLTSCDLCMDLPLPYLKTWSQKQLIKIFARDNQKTILSRFVARETREVLAKWGWLVLAEERQLLDRLTRKPFPPVPAYDLLREFWESLQNEEIGYYWNKKSLAIVPAKGGKALMPAEEVVVISSKERQFTDDEWNFISEHISIVDPDWIEFIAHPKEDSPRESANDLLVNLGLDRSQVVETIIRRASVHIFEQAEPGDKGIRIAHIAARMNVDLPDDFKYLCQDGCWRSVDDGLLTEHSLSLESLLPNDTIQRLTIHSNYDPGPAFRNEWLGWLRSPKSRLREFILPESRQSRYFSRINFENFLKEHGSLIPESYPREVGPYKGTFRFNDYDFDEKLWEHWENAAHENPNQWVDIIRMIACDWDSLWGEMSHATASQEYYGRIYSFGKFPANWVLRLQAKKCLLDTHRRLQYPSALLRTTPQNAHLLKIERFVHPDFDRQESIEFLGVLGVREQPDNPEIVLTRLRALAAISEPPMDELLDVYQAMDSVLLHGANSHDQAIREIFCNERLILGEDNNWHTSFDIFQRNDDRIPGMVTIASLFAALGLWPRIGVPFQPEIANALDWLALLPQGKPLHSEEKKRVEAVLRRAPDSVWQKVRCWLTLDGLWSSVDELQWQSSAASSLSGLFPWVKQHTADLSFLDDAGQGLDVFRQTPFLEASLGAHINQLRLNGTQKPLPEWLQFLASRLARIKSDHTSEQGAEAGFDYGSIRQLARRLMDTNWQDIELLEVAPTLNGQPAGESQYPVVYWHENTLYVRETGPNSHREFVKVFTDVFQNPNIRTAVRDCFERKSEWIDTYFKTYFSLDPEEGLLIPPSSTDTVPAGEPAAENAENREGQSVVSDLRDDHGNQPPSISSQEKAEEPQEKSENQPKEHEPKERQSAEERVADIFGQMGYTWVESSNQFSGRRGTIKKEKGPFHWVEYDAGGFRKNRYWTSSKSLDKGVEIPSEIWELMKASPKNSWLILAEEEGQFRPYNWDELQKSIRTGAISLHPATYRLVSHQHENEVL